MKGWLFIREQEAAMRLDLNGDIWAGQRWQGAVSKSVAFRNRS